ncbi:MAG: protein kinase [Ktedonobacteraceae bacterium]|nr:protein kinase [Ktedonobacteraceae bacterium]MBO0789907.1 protein kinase [Ktedonobacteraceae bacterium]
MGEVWLCEDPRLRRQVAIKTLPPHNQNDQEFSARFEREAQAAAALSHPHILPVHDYGEHVLPNGQVITYIVMPYIGGGSLADRINKLAANNQGMVQTDALNYLTQAAEAIDYAHAQGVVHRDIKPANMLLRSDDWLMLADFGIARIMSSTDNLTQAGAGIGTPEYMAPEQAQGHAVGSSDNYSLAVIAYQLFTGRPPFSAETSYATTIQHLTMPPPSPRQFNPHLPEACEQVLMHSLAKNPAERFPSAQALVEGLKRSLGANAQPFFAQQPHTPDIETPQTNMTGPNGLQPLQATHGTDSRPSLKNGGSKLPSANQPQNVTRRNILIGGAAALVVVGASGGIWAYANRATLFKPATTPVPTHAPQPTPTPDPNGPALVLRDHNKPAGSLAWSPTQNILYSAADDNSVKSWNVDQLQQQKKEEYTSTGNYPFNGIEKQLLWTTDGQYLIVGSARVTDDLSSTIIDVYKSDMSGPIAGLDKGITVPSLSLKGVGWYQKKYIAALWTDLKVDKKFFLGLWNPTQTGFHPQPLSFDGFPALGTIGDPISDLKVSPDGTLIALCTDDGIAVGSIAIQGTTLKWKPQPYSPLQFHPKQVFGNEARTAAWTASGHGLISASEDSPGNTVAAWDIRTPSDQFQFGLPSTSTFITTLATYPSTEKALLAGGAKDGTVYIWDGNQNNIPTRTLNSGGLKGEVLALAWSHDGRWLAASYKDTDASIIIWNI